MPHGVGSRRTSRPVQPGSMAWRRYHGSAATTCSSWPRAASSATMRVEHAARRRGVGLDVRAEHDEAQRAVSHRCRRVATGLRRSRTRRGGRPRPSAAPDAAVVNGAARASPAATSSSRRGATSSSAPSHASSSSGRTSAASPATSGRAARSLQIDRRAERHRLEHRRPEPLVLGREHERLGRRPSGRRGRPPAPGPGGSTRGPSSSAAIAAGDLVLGEAAPTEQHEREVGIAPRPGQQVEQEAVVLVGVGERRVDDVAAGRRGRSAARSSDAGVTAAGRSTPWGTTTTRSASMRKPSRIVARTYSLGTATTSAWRTERGTARRRYWRFSGVRYSRVRAVLHVVDREQHRAAASAAARCRRRGGRRRRRASRGGSHVASATTRRLRRRASSERRRARVAGGQLGVGGGEARHARTAWRRSPGATSCEPGELAGEVLLRAADARRAGTTAG